MIHLMRLHRTSEHSEPMCPKFFAVHRWVTRHLQCADHEIQVAAIASSLFDITRPLHGLSVADRRLLRLGALVHDVGRSISKPDHPSHGAEMLTYDEELPLERAERRALTYLTLYHRGPVPRAGRDVVLRKSDDAERMLRILGLLRSADALDSRSLKPAPRIVFALCGSVLRTTCYLESDSAKARKTFRRRKKLGLLEQLLDVRMEIEIDHAESLRLVA